MAIQSKPDIPRGTRSRVYQKLVELLQTDPHLALIFPEDAWTVSRGENFDPYGVAGPHIYLKPRMVSNGWFGPDANLGTLVVEYYIWLEGNDQARFDALDVMDVQELIEQVFHPLNDPDSSKQWARRKQLTEAGAHSGVITFNLPANQEQSANSGFLSHGQFQLDVIRRLSP